MSPLGYVSEGGIHIREQQGLGFTVTTNLDKTRRKPPDGFLTKNEGLRSVSLSVFVSQS